MDGLEIMAFVCTLILVCILIGYWNRKWLQYFWESITDKIAEHDDNVYWRIEARKRRKSGETKV